MPAASHRTAPAWASGVRAAGWVVLLLALVGLVGPAAGRAAEASVVVDSRRATGTIDRDVAGVTVQPGSDPQLRRAGTRFTRYGTGVVEAFLQSLFPAPPPEGTPPAEVNFDAPALLRHDMAVDHLFEAGMRPIMTLDVPRWLGPTSGASTSSPPPADPALFQQLVLRVVRHYTADRVKKRLKPVLRWEASNEPDGVVGAFFTGTREQWLNGVFLPIARVLNQVSRETGLKLKLGGCGCWIFNEDYMGRMFDFARNRGIRVDFASWHYYGNYPFLGPDGPEPGGLGGGAALYRALARVNPAATPAVFGQQVNDARALARQRLGYVPELINTEWNISAGGYDRRQDSASGAAFDAAALIEMQRAGADGATFETSLDPFGDPQTNPAQKDLYGDLGLITHKGRLKPSWWAFKLFGDLGSRQVAISSPGLQPERDGVFSLASKTRGRSRVTVMLASWKALGAPNRVVRLRVRGLRGRWQARIYRLDGRRRSARRPISVRRFRSSTRLSLPGQSVVFVELRGVSR